MSFDEIEKVRAASRARGAGPWVQWWEEMARKTVARRHAKVLPMSTDLDDLMRRDDDLYDFQAARENGSAEQPRPRLASMLDQIAQRPEPAAITDESAGSEVEEGEVVDADDEGDAGVNPADTSSDFPGNDTLNEMRTGRRA